MKLSEIIKALEDGKSVKTDDNSVYSAEYYKDDRLHCFGNIINDISCHRKFEIVEPNKVVSITGWNTFTNGSWGDEPMEEDTHKITFEVDKDNNPICDTIKMVEL